MFAGNCLRAAPNEELLNKAPVVRAGINSLRAFQASFEKEGAVLTKEIVGFTSKLSDEKAAVAIFNLFTDPTSNEEKLQNTNYDCSLVVQEGHSPNAIPCNFLDISHPRTYTAAEGFFSVPEFKEAALSFLSVLEEGNQSVEVAQRLELNNINEVKFWRSKNEREANIWIVYKVYTNTEARELLTRYMYCHKHLVEGELKIDCHRRRSLDDSAQPNLISRNPERFQPESF